MVAGDVIGGGDGRQAPGDLRRIAVLRPPVFVLQVPQEENVLRLLCSHFVKQVLMMPAESRTMKIAEHHDPAAVKPGGQIGERGRKAGHLQGGVAPIQESGQTQDRQRQCGEFPPAAAPGMFWHEKYGLLRRFMKTRPGRELILAQGCPPKAALQNIPYYIIAVWTWREEKYTK